jgi:hypothetical protein
VYPTSQKVAKLSGKDAEIFYQNLRFFHLVLPFIGTPSGSIKGTLAPVKDLTTTQMFPDAVVVKDLAKWFYSGAGSPSNDLNDALSAISNGKYIEVASPGWRAHPNGVNLDSAIGSGIFWDPGNLIVGPNKVAIAYKAAGQSFGKLTAALVKSDPGGTFMTAIKRISEKTGISPQMAIQKYVSDNRTFVKTGEQGVYDAGLRAVCVAAGYDSCMAIADISTVESGDITIQLVDFRNILEGNFVDGIINCDMVGIWNEFAEKYLSLRDPFNIDDVDNISPVSISFPNIMFSGTEASRMCKAGPKCGSVLPAGINSYCSLMGCYPSDTPQSWKRGKNISQTGCTTGVCKNISLLSPGGLGFALNNSRDGLSMTNISLTTARILEMTGPNLKSPRINSTLLSSVQTASDTGKFLSLMSITKPSNLTDGLRNYLKLTFPLSAKYWDTLSHNDMADIYTTLDAHYMPLLLPIGKVTVPPCTSVDECKLPPSRYTRTQMWAFDGIHIEGASGSDVYQDAAPTKNYPISTPYFYQNVSNPFNGGSGTVFDTENMILIQGGIPSYAWVESVQYADESGGARLRGEYSYGTVIGPNSCECSPENECTTYVKESFDDIPCDPSMTGTTHCSIGQKCNGRGASSYCSIPDAHENCALTVGSAPFVKGAVCGYFDYKHDKWMQAPCTDKDRCTWSLASNIKSPQTPTDLYNCYYDSTNPKLCGIPWNNNTKKEAQTVHIPVIQTMYYPQMGYGRFTNYGKTGIYTSNVSFLLTIPDLNLRMTMEQILQLVGEAEGEESIHYQLDSLQGDGDWGNTDSREFLSGYVVLPNTEYNAIPAADRGKIFKISNKRSVTCENPLINPEDDPRLKNISQNFTPLYVPPEARVKNPRYGSNLTYNYETSIQLLTAMYIYGCTGNHRYSESFPFGSYNSYGMVLGHLAYVRTIAMGWNTVQLVRDPDGSDDALKYCEWPFYDIEVIHVAAKPPAWFRPTMAKAADQSYPKETDGYGFDLSVGGVWADSEAPKPYVFCRGFFCMDISRHLASYLGKGYLQGTGDWDKDVALFNPQPVERNLFRQSQLPGDEYAIAIREYYDPATWKADPIIYDQTCPFPEWQGWKCTKKIPNCVTTPAGEGIYWQAMRSSKPHFAWPSGINKIPGPTGPDAGP